MVVGTEDPLWGRLLLECYKKESRKEGLLLIFLEELRSSCLSLQGIQLSSRLPRCRG